MRLLLSLILSFSSVPRRAYSQDRIFKGENCASCHTQIRDRAPGQPPQVDPDVVYGTQDEHDVIVVGGGLAGLSAAYYLKGLNVLVLEKEDKVGGKVQSGSWGSNSYGVAADYMFEPYWPPIVEMFKDLDIKGEILPAPTNSFLFPDGKRVDEPLSKKGISQLPFSKDTRERLKKMMDDWKKFAGDPVLGSMPPVPPKILSRAVPWDRRMTVKELDQRTFKDYLVKKYGPKPKKDKSQAKKDGSKENGEFAQFINEFVDRYNQSLFGAAGDAALPGIGFASADYDEGAKNITWEQGPGIITGRLADKIGGDHIITGALVTYVTRNDKGVWVEYSKDGKRYLKHAKAAVMAVPSPVSKHLLIGMPKWKADALDKVRYSTYPKALIALNRPFSLGAFDVWPMQQDTIFSDLVQENWGRKAHPIEAPGAPAQLIDAYMGMGETKGRVSLINMTDEEISRAVQDDFLKLFPDLKPEDIHGIRIIRWGHAMPVQYPKYMTEVRPQVAKPVQRIFFAGVDTQMPCIEGAIASGYFAAKQVHAYLKRPK